MRCPTEGPLAGVRVIELGQLLAGPFCGQLLGDFGAEVIKVEPPGAGDPMRQWGREKPHGQVAVVAGGRPQQEVGRPATCATPRGQDARPPAGRDQRRADRELPAGHAGALGPRLRAALAEINPRLVITRVTGFGQTGPYAPRAGFGSIGEAMGGLRYVHRRAGPAAGPGRHLDRRLARRHVRRASARWSRCSERQRTGRGQVVDSAIYEAVLAMMESLVPEWQVAGYQRERTGAILPNIAPSNVYPTADGELGAHRRQPGHGVPPAGRARWASRSWPTTRGTRRHGARGAQHGRAGRARSRRWSAGYDADELLATLDAAGVPGRAHLPRRRTCWPTRTCRSAEAMVTVPDPTFGELAMQNVAPRLSGTPGAVRCTRARARRAQRRGLPRPARLTPTTRSPA